MTDHSNGTPETHTKFCRGCGVVKPTDAFSRDRGACDGLYRGARCATRRAIGPTMLPKRRPTVPPSLQCDARTRPARAQTAGWLSAQPKQGETGPCRLTSHWRNARPA